MTLRQLAAAIRAADADMRKKQTRAVRVQTVAKRIVERIAPAIDAHREAERTLRHLIISRTLRRGISAPLATLRERFVLWRYRATKLEGIAPWQRASAKKRMETTLRKLRARCPHPFLLSLHPPDSKCAGSGEVMTNGHRECALCTTREARMYIKGRLSMTLDDVPGRLVTAVEHEEFEPFSEELKEYGDIATLTLRFRTIMDGARK